MRNSLSKAFLSNRLRANYCYSRRPNYKHLTISLRKNYQIKPGSTRPGGSIDPFQTSHLCLSSGEELKDRVGSILPIQEERFYSHTRSSVLPPYS